MVARMSQWNEPQGDPYGQTRNNPAYGQQPPPPGYPQQPGYAPQGYGQPGMGPRGPYVPPNPDSFGIVGTVMALLGGVVLVVSFTALEWFADFGGTQSGGSVSFGDVSNVVGNSSAAKGFASAYFGWLAWLFVIVVVVAGVLASVPSPALRVFRIIGVVVGFAAAGLSFLAIQLFDNSSYLDYLKHARIGFYFAVIGFVVAGIGAAIGPRHV
jgi:hypothetical protein